MSSHNWPEDESTVFHLGRTPRWFAPRLNAKDVIAAFEVLATDSDAGGGELIVGLVSPEGPRGLVQPARADKA